MVIDLGETAADVPEAPWSPRASRLRPAAFVTAVLAVLALGGSAATAPRMHVALVTDDMPAAFALSPAALFTTGYAGTQAVVRRYATAGGPVRWSTRLPQFVGGARLAETAGILAVTSPDSVQASFLDTETGVILWRRTSGATVVHGTSGDSAVMTSPAATGEKVLLQRVALRTGTTLWSHDVDAAGYLDADGPHHIVTVDRQGRAAVLNPADGAVLATADFGVTPDLSRYDTDGDTARFTTIEDRLYLARRVSGAVSLTAYHLADLRQVWRSTATPFGWPGGCGAFLCLTTTTGMTVLDAATGEPRWSSTKWRQGEDSRALGIPGPSRLVVSDARHTLRRAVLEPGSGRVLMELGNSVQIGSLLLRLDAERVGRIWIQAVGADDALGTVASLDGVSLERCVAAGRWLACATRTGRVSVWQLPD